MRHDRLGGLFEPASRICFSLNKEPHFYSENRSARRPEGNFSDCWRRNFGHFNPALHKAIGEGSGTFTSPISRSPTSSNTIRVGNSSNGPQSRGDAAFLVLRPSFLECRECQPGRRMGAGKGTGERPPHSRQCRDPHSLQYRKLAALEFPGPVEHQARNESALGGRFPQKAAGPLRTGYCGLERHFGRDLSAWWRWISNSRWRARLE